MIPESFDYDAMRMLLIGMRHDGLVFEQRRRFVKPKPVDPVTVARKAKDKQKRKMAKASRKKNRK